MKYPLAFCLLLAACTTRAQEVIHVNNTDYHVGISTYFIAGGQPFVNVKFINLVEGTPYYSDDWMRGILISKDSQVYKNIQIRLDLVDNGLHYLDSAGREFISTTPLREVVLINRLGDTAAFVHSSFLTGYNSLLPAGWYRRLVQGRASLYVYYKKLVEPVTRYGGTSNDQAIRTETVFVVQTPAGLTEVKKIKDLPDVLNDRRAEMNAFLQNRDNRKATSEERFAAAIDYYNSLNP